MELHAYFQSYENYFWQWETDYDVLDEQGLADYNLLGVPGHGAIVYRPLLESILYALQPQGLPTFGALLLAFMATQDNFALTQAALEIIKTTPNSYTYGVESPLIKATDLLKKINALEHHLRHGQNRLLLFQVLFKNAHNLHSAGSADMLLKKLKKRPYKLAACSAKEPLSNVVIFNDLRCLAFIDNRFPTTTAIKDAMKGFIEEPEVDEEIVEEAVGLDEEKDFVQQLAEDPKTFAVGSLIKRIWSGLKIPMRHLSPGEQPIAGISDLINKGDLHRMLLSEFANDEVIFLSRIANNEALYIQREIPPEENIFERVILIDASLRNWGTPKIIAFALALAIVKHPKAHTSCRVFILGENIQEINVSTVNDVIDSLNQLSPVLDVAQAVDLFFEKHQEEKLEVFLVTHEDCLNTATMQKAIHEHRDQLKYIMSTTLEGTINIFKQHNGTKKHVQKMLLPLDELWAHPPQHKKQAEKKSKDKKIELQKNYPLLFATPNDSIAVLYCGERYYFLSSAKHLFQVHIKSVMYPSSGYSYITFKGVSLLSESLSIKARGMFALTENNSGELVLFQFQPDKHHLSRLNLVTKEYEDFNTMKLFISNSFKIAPGKGCIYCYDSGFQNIWKFPVEGTLENTELGTLPFDVSKIVEANNTALQKYQNNSGRIVSNFHNIGIDEQQQFVFSKYAFTYSKDNYIISGRGIKSLKHKTVRHKNSFTFEDGSEVITDSRGMMIFRSANRSIPEFYMPAIKHQRSAIATSKVFGGEEHFYNEETSLVKKSIEYMYDNYLGAFIKHIWEHGTEH